MVGAASARAKEKRRECGGKSGSATRPGKALGRARMGRRTHASVPFEESVDKMEAQSRAAPS